MKIKAYFYVLILTIMAPVLIAEHAGLDQLHAKKRAEKRDSGVVVLLSVSPITNAKIILLGRAGDRWRLLGGRTESGQDFASAARQEVYEESARSYDLDIELFRRADAAGDYFEARKSSAGNRYRLYKMSAEYKDKATLDQAVNNIKGERTALEAEVVNAKGAGDISRWGQLAYQISKLKKFLEASEYLWVNFSDVTDALARDNRSLTVTTADGSRKNIVFHERDWKRLRNAYANGFLAD